MTAVNTSYIAQNKDLTPLPRGYLDNASLFTSVLVCKAWRDHLEKQRIPILEETYCQRMNYPPWIIKAMRCCNLSLFRLPLLTLEQLEELESLEDLTYFDRILEEGVDDDVEINPTHLATYQEKTKKFPSLAHFIDKNGLPGIVLKVRATIEGNFGIGTCSDFTPDPSRIDYVDYRNLSIILIYRRSRISNTWRMKDNRVQEIYVSGDVEHPEEIRLRILPCCPPLLNDNEEKWFTLLIAQKDPMVRLDGEIQQVKTAIPAQPAAPPITSQPPPPDLAPLPTAPSISRTCFDAICAFFSLFYALCRSLFSLCRS